MTERCMKPFYRDKSTLLRPNSDPVLHERETMCCRSSFKYTSILDYLPLQTVGKVEWNHLGSWLYCPSNKIVISSSLADRGFWNWSSWVLITWKTYFVIENRLNARIFMRKLEHCKAKKEKKGNRIEIIK